MNDRLFALTCNAMRQTKDEFPAWYEALKPGDRQAFTLWLQAECKNYGHSSPGPLGDMAAYVGWHLWQQTERHRDSITLGPIYEADGQTLASELGPDDWFVIYGNRADGLPVRRQVEAQPVAIPDKPGYFWLPLTPSDTSDLEVAATLVCPARGLHVVCYVGQLWP